MVTSSQRTAPTTESKDATKKTNQSRQVNLLVSLQSLSYSLERTTKIQLLVLDDLIRNSVGGLAQQQA
jgi:hypothetical protein